MASTNSIYPFRYPGGVVRPTASLEEAQRLWWPLMTSLGWNRSFNDLETHIAASNSEGFLVALPDGSDTLVGHVMATIYDNSTAWVTLFVVQPEHQGKGQGAGLFSAMMEEIKHSGTAIVGLDAVVEQKKTYERRGFVESTMGKIRCMSCDLSSQSNAQSVARLDAGMRIVDIKEVPKSLLVQSDLNHTGVERKGLWSTKFLNRSDLFGLALIQREEANDVRDIRAWTIVRRVPLGFRLGPVYAADENSAQTIILAAMERASKEPKETSNSATTNTSSTNQMTAELWDGNPNAMSTFEECGWYALGVDYHRMWLNGKATQQQSEGGLAHLGMYAVFDAAIG